MNSSTKNCFVRRKKSAKSNVGVDQSAQNGNKSEIRRSTENLEEVEQKTPAFGYQQFTRCPCTTLEIEAALRYQRKRERKATEQVKISENQQQNKKEDEQTDDKKWSTKFLTSIEKEASSRSKNRLGKKKSFDS